MAKFIRGETVQVYEDPITELVPAFRGLNLGCVQANCGVWDDRPLRRYLVLPDGDGACAVEVSIRDRRGA